MAEPSRRSSAPRSRSFPGGGSMAKAKANPLPRIFVVDDKRDTPEIIRQYLEVRGYPTTVAHSGDEALALFENVKPALVLLDVMMPGRDGWEVCRAMKQHPQLGRLVRV